jgi:hypothetical protein
VKPKRNLPQNYNVKIKREKAVPFTKTDAIKLWRALSSTLLASREATDEKQIDPVHSSLEQSPKG